MKYECSVQEWGGGGQCLRFVLIATAAHAKITDVFILHEAHFQESHERRKPSIHP